MTLVLPDAIAELEPVARQLHEALRAQTRAVSAPEFLEILTREFPEVRSWLLRGEASLRIWLCVLYECGWLRREMSPETGDFAYTAEAP